MGDPSMDPAPRPAPAAADGGCGALDDSPGFQPGDLLCGRFRIVRLLGRGGTGEVYRARDEQLRATVALKVCRPDLLGDAAVLERFRREVLLARRVTHPNVCRVFDVFTHHGGLAQTSAPFVTMELLGGETLAARLRRVGRLEPKAALPVVKQVVDALEAAHRLGIVHRDLKSNNIVLAPSDGEERAILVDFGLAVALRRESGSPPPDPPVAERAAPEGPPEAADIQALGALMHHMVTGQRPRAVRASGGDAGAEAPSPRAHVPPLDPRWERAIRRCLAPDPHDRYARPRDVLAELTARPPRWRWPGAPPVARAALAAAAIAFGLGLVDGWPGREAMPAAAAERAAEPASGGPRSVMVLEFSNLARLAEKEWLAEALPRMLRTELAMGSSLVGVSAEDVSRLRLRTRHAGGFARDTLRTLHRRTGTHVVVLGSYLALGEAGSALRVDWVAQDALTGDSIAAGVERGTERDLARMVVRAGASLRRRLGAPDPAAARGGREAILIDGPPDGGAP